MATEFDQLFVKAAVAKGMVPPEIAEEALAKAKADGEAGSWLVKKGYLTRHLVHVLGDEVTRSQMPKVIGNYRILSKLGHGGMGSVFKAVQLSLQREVALKVMAGRLARRQEWIDRFLAEARSMASIHHPHVLICFDAGNDKGKLYLAMELMHGGDLVRLLRARDGRVPVDEALRIIRDCASGLEAVARAGLIHRDIKPGNIFLDHDGAAKLGDLGLACLAEAHAEEAAAADGRPIGTPAFMSPEQARGDEDLDIRTDIYALGATLFALLTGQPPFGGKNSFAVIAKVLKDPPPDPRVIVPGIPAEVAEVTRRCMAKERDERPRTPADLRRLIEEAARAIGVSLEARTAMAAPPAAVDADAATDRWLVQPSFAPVGGEDQPPAEQRPVLDLDSAGSAGSSFGGADRRDDLAPDGGGLGPEGGGRVRRLGKSDQRVGVAAPSSDSGITPVEAPAERPSWIPDWSAAWGIDALDNGGPWVDLVIGGVTQRLRFIRPGAFTMGSPPDEPGRRADETPHEVSFSHPVWIADTPVTQALWNAVKTQGGIMDKLSSAVRGRHKSRFVGDDLPVELVSWTECADFCARLSRAIPGVKARLPTESEWEFACRAGAPGAHAGDSLGALGWFTGNAFGTSHPVKRKKPNAWGLYDCLGNVWEWCEDCYADYPAIALRNPVQRHGIYRVCRGGSYVDDADNCRAARRSPLTADISRPFIGMRLAIDVVFPGR